MITISASLSIGMVMDKEQADDGKEHREEQQSDDEAEDTSTDGIKRKYVGLHIIRNPRCCRNLTQAGLSLMRQPRATGVVRTMVVTERSTEGVEESRQSSRLST